MQLNLIPKNEYSIKSSDLNFGGGLRKGQRKIKRPLIEGKITHVVFKSSKAVGKMSFLQRKGYVNSLLKQKSKKFFIEIIEWVNMSNHLHLKVRFKDRKRMSQFMKSFAGTLARKITGACRGNKVGKFWDGLVFTRVLMTSFEELRLRIYFEANHREREFGYSERVYFLKGMSQKFRGKRRSITD